MCIPSEIIRTATTHALTREDVYSDCILTSAGVDLSGWATYQCQGHCSRIDTIPRHMPTWLRNVVVSVSEQLWRTASGYHCKADRVLNRQSRASSHRKGSRSKQPRQL
ncbi:hypothetical protein KCU92_g348, partial [Aureobasidium melanogenum]